MNNQTETLPEVKDFTCFLYFNEMTGHDKAIVDEMMVIINLFHKITLDGPLLLEETRRFG
jgi:hypothetical protein